MALRFDDIPDLSQDPGRPGDDRPPSAALTGLQPSTHPRRRFLRYVSLASMGVGAAALSALTLDVGPFRASRAMAEVDPVRGYGEFLTSTGGCSEYGSYNEVADAEGSAYRVYAAACIGPAISHSNCTWGWHANPINTACTAHGTASGTRNAWRWRNADGRVFRCSDGHNSSGYLTICRQRVE